jgi:hypothetical protein
VSEELSELQKQTRMMARPEAAKINLACGLMGLVAGLAVWIAVPNTTTAILALLLPLPAGFWGYRTTIRHLTR